MEPQEIVQKRIRRNTKQPREYFDTVALGELADSIKEIGQITPIEVKAVSDDPEHDYELVDGERRWRACGLAGIQTMKAWVNTYADADEEFIRSVAANFGREGHTPMEAARAIQRIMESPRYREGGKYDRTWRVSKLFAKSQSWVLHHLNLLELHPDVQAMLEPNVPEERRIGSTMAALLHGIKDLELQRRIAGEIVEGGLKLNQARRLARKLAEQAGEKVGSGRRYKPSDAHQALSRFLDYMNDRAEMVLDTPQRGFVELMRSRSETERQVILAQIDENIERLKTIRESVERASQP